VKFTPKKFVTKPVNSMRSMEYRLLSTGKLQARVGSSGWQSSRFFETESELKGWLKENSSRLVSTTDRRERLHRALDSILQRVT
jgi:hypothetical protein